MKIKSIFFTILCAFAMCTELQTSSFARKIGAKVWSKSMRSNIHAAINVGIACGFINDIKKVYTARLVKNVDPELQQLFEQVKKDYGIIEDVPFYCIEEGDSFFGLSSKTSSALYGRGIGIFIYLDYVKNYKEDVVFTLAHELEHHRQYKKYPGSYHGRNRMSKEQAADAAAADYVNCVDCLLIAKNCLHEHNPRDTNDGSFTTPGGYLSKQDLNLWIDRAREEKSYCRRHESSCPKHESSTFGTGKIIEKLFVSIVFGSAGLIWHWKYY